MKCACVVWVVLLGACTFTTSLDGLSTGAIRMDAGAPPDASPEVEAAAPAGYAAAVLADRPLLYLRLNGKTEDVSGNALPVIVHGDLQTAPGALSDGDLATSFDGTSACIEVKDGRLDFLDAHPFTIELFVKVPHPTGSYARVVSNETDALDGYKMWVVNAPLRIGFERYGGAVHDSLVAPLASASDLFHVAVTYDGAELVMFLDGARAASIDSSARLPAGQPFSLAGGVGCQVSFVASTLDEVAVYDHALAPERVAAHIRAR
jgi:hypothetical protein